MKTEPKFARITQNHYLTVAVSPKGGYRVTSGAADVLKSDPAEGLVVELGSVATPGTKGDIPNSLTGLFGFRPTAVALAEAQQAAEKKGEKFIAVPVSFTTKSQRTPAATSLAELPAAQFIDLTRLAADASVLTENYLTRASKRDGLKERVTLDSIHLHRGYIAELLKKEAFRSVGMVAYSSACQNRYSTIVHRDLIETAACKAQPITPRMQEVLWQIMVDEDEKLKSTLKPYMVARMAIAPEHLKALARSAAFVNFKMKFYTVPDGKGHKVVYDWAGKWNGRDAITVNSIDIPLTVLLPQ